MLDNRRDEPFTQFGGENIQLSWVNSCTSGHELAHFDGGGGGGGWGAVVGQAPLRLVYPQE